MSKTIAAIKIAQKQLGLDDDTYRAKLENLTGKDSTRLMSEVERQKVLVNLRSYLKDQLPSQHAVRHDGRDGKHRLSGKYLPKMRALWIACYNLGIIADRRDVALEAFAMGRQLPEISDMRFVHKAEDGASVIEALKGMLARYGVVWSNSDLCADHEKSHGYKIAVAQWSRLRARSGDFWPIVTELVNQRPSYRDLTDAEWITVMNWFGAQIRREKAAAKKVTS
ncbi:MAG: regulatory protein GemA [Agrobacterium cavarae]